jgi:hypothetical protein
MVYAGVTTDTVAPDQAKDEGEGEGEGEGEQSRNPHPRFHNRSIQSPVSGMAP